MTELYLVRHGETEWSRDGRHTSVTDLGLTETGRTQAEALRPRLAGLDFGLVLCSPRQRARQTAGLAGLDPATTELTDDLAEWAYGDYEGITSEQVHQSDPGWTIWTHPTPGGEDVQQVTRRLTRVIERVRGSGVDRAVCVGHGHASRALALLWLGLDLRRGESFPLDTGTISVLGSSKGQPALLAWNA